MKPDNTTPGGGVGGKTGPGESAQAAMVRAVIVEPVIARHGRPADDTHATSRGSHSRSPEARLEEAVGLALAIDLEPVHTEIVQIAAPKPATLMGSGKVAALADIVAGHEAELVIVDQALSPVQQRNLESALKAKVLDRTGLILEIFGRRARHGLDSLVRSTGDGGHRRAGVGVAPVVGLGRLESGRGDVS